MENNKNLLITIIIISVLISSLFGAGSAFLVVGSGITSQQEVQGFLQKIWLDFLVQDDKISDLFDSDKKVIKIEEESSVVEAVEKASPAVVSIIITKDLPKLESFYYSPFGDDDFFNDFFNDFLVPGTRQNGTERREVGGGSGFIISKDGLVVTNKHVVLDQEADYSVLLNDERTYEAEVLARDPINDLAVLKIKGDNHDDLPTVELGDSSILKTGQTVIAIGNALGEFRNTVSVGVISGLARSITASGGAGFAEELTNIIQTDAAINPGNSGGPLLNLAGQVIGINTAISQQGQGIGFAISINEVKNSIQSVKDNGKIVRPWLGVRYIMLNEEIAKSNNLDINEGAIVVRGEQRTDLAIIPGSPADKAGLVENDIILEIDGNQLNRENHLAKVISKYKPGDEIELKIWHKGEEKTVKVKLGEFGE